MIKSLRWPGAYCYSTDKGKKFANIYLGNGIKYLGCSFTPLLQVQVCKDVDEPKEMKDPTVISEKRAKGGEEMEEGKDETADENQDDEQDNQDEDDQ